MFIRGAVAGWIMDIFPLFGADAADVWGVRELFFVVIFVEEGFSPGWVALLNEFFEGFAVDIFEWFCVAEFQDGWCDVNGKDELFNDFWGVGWC